MAPAEAVNPPKRSPAINCLLIPRLKCSKFSLDLNSASIIVPRINRETNELDAIRPMKIRTVTSHLARRALPTHAHDNPDSWWDNTVEIFFMEYLASHNQGILVHGEVDALTGVNYGVLLAGFDCGYCILLKSIHGMSTPYPVRRS